MSKGILIGLSGKARSGKDTLGNILSEELKGFGIVKAAFADELKKQVAEHFDLSYEQLYGDLKEVEDKRYKKPGPPQGVAVRYSDGRGLPPWYWTSREIMQNYGAFMRTIDYNYWVKALFKQLKIKGVHSAVITDCRHPNEVDFVVEKGGYHIRIYRNDKDAIHNSNHVSETALDAYEVINFKVKNNGTLEDLKLKAKELANIIKEDYENG